jgi:hypothetical protein
MQMNNVNLFVKMLWKDIHSEIDSKLCIFSTYYTFQV